MHGGQFRWIGLRMIVLTLDYEYLRVPLQHQGTAFGRLETGAAIIVASTVVDQKLKVILFDQQVHGAGQCGQQFTRMGASFEEIFQLSGRQNKWLSLGRRW